MISLSWPPSPAYFNEAMTYKLHIINDDQVIEMIAVNETVYRYSFNENECETYKFAVYAVNGAGKSANSTDTSVAVPNGEYSVY